MHIEDVPERPTPAQLRLLRAHLPYSLTVLRRLQVAAGAFDGVTASRGIVGAGTTAYAHVLFAYDDDSEDDSSPDRPFAAVYLDHSKAPETAAWIYASDQDDDPGTDPDAVHDSDRPGTWVVDRGAQLAAAWPPARRTRCCRLVLALLRRVRALAADVPPAAFASPDIATDARIRVKTNLHDGVRYLLQAGAGGRPVTASYWDAYDKWLFPLTGLPADDVSVSPLTWDAVHTPADTALVKSRTRIPRTDATLLSVPSVALRDPASGVLQAWAFLGTDDSLWTLHTEPPWRGRGLARAVAARLFRQYGGLFARPADEEAEEAEEDKEDKDGADDDAAADPGWFAADVSATNRQSQAVCRRLGGRRRWSTSW